jgi:predicted amidohydrolase YtcJ
MNKHNFRRWLARLTAIGMVAAGVVSCGGSNDPVVQPATLVLRGGKVMTMDAGGTIASAVAVRGGRIVAVGSDAAMAGYINDETKVVELDGRMLLPGFIDAHIHPVLGSERMNECSAGGETLKVDVLVQIALDCVAADPAPRNDKWIQVVNVNPATFVATADDLDAISTVRPVILIGIDGHTSWVNHKALTLAGITAATPDPVGGQIERDAHGNPTGFLKDAAQGLVTALIPPLSFAERKALAQQAIELIRSKGITSVQDAWASEEAMDVYEALAKDGTLKMRVRATLASEVVDDEAEYKRLNALRARFAHHDLIRANGVKIFSDGVIEYPTQTAAMIVPYYDGHGGATTNYGGRYFEQSVLNAYVTRLDAEGFTVHTHSIGDYTTHAVLDALAYARDKNGVTDNRHQISHLQVVDPADFPRFAALGVAANMQLFWALPDVYTIDAVQPYMRPDRFELMYPAGSLLDAGAELVGGSDWPVDVFPDDPMPNTRSMPLARCGSTPKSARSRSASWPTSSSSTRTSPRSRRRNCSRCRCTTRSSTARSSTTTRPRRWPPRRRCARLRSSSRPARCARAPRAAATTSAATRRIVMRRPRPRDRSARPSRRQAGAEHAGGAEARQRPGGGWATAAR